MSTANAGETGEDASPASVGAPAEPNGERPESFDVFLSHNGQDKPAVAKSNRVRVRHAGIKPDRTIRAWRKLDKTRTPVFKPREKRPTLLSGCAAWIGKLTTGSRSWIGPPTRSSG